MEPPPPPPLAHLAFLPEKLRGLASRREARCLITNLNFSARKRLLLTFSTRKMADIEIEEIDAESALPVPDAPAQHNDGRGDSSLVPTNFTSLLPFVAFIQTPTHWQNSEEIADKLQILLPSHLSCLGAEPLLKVPQLGFTTENWKGVHLVCLQHEAQIVSCSTG
jgi:hypothetical protein